MKKILILGAGRSSTTLINFLLKEAECHRWRITVGDLDERLAREKLNRHPSGQAIKFDILNPEDKEKIGQGFDLVISMLPAVFHLHVAQVCASAGVSMLTASYVNEDIKVLHDEFVAQGVGVIMEMGLDPGIDHMSAMKVLNRIKDEGHKLRSFETFTGGLLAPVEGDDNPWGYKFTWNPRNVVLAGQGFVKFIQEGRYKYIPYSKVFRRAEIIHIPEHGYFEGYANRDSLKYLVPYQLDGIETLYRGTLRRVGFCRAWDVFVQLGATDDSYAMQHVAHMTHRQFINSFLSYNPQDSVELKLAQYLSLDVNGEEMFKIKWLGLFDDEPVGLSQGTPAQILEHILKKKWTMKKYEKDMIVMWHQFEYFEGEVLKKTESYMTVKGEDASHTAMSKTVGLPLAVSAKLVLEGKIKPLGVQIPTEKAIYEPMLKTLSDYGITFSERTTV